MTHPPDEPTLDEGPRPGGPPATGEVDTIDEVAERLAVDLAEDWKAGRRRPVEDVLERHPEVRDHPRAAVRLIYEEICLRQDEGPGPPTVEMLGRFPRYRDELRMLLAGHRLLAEDEPPPRFPRVGESLGDARLLVELGRGAMGRVFLATQAGLADRPVVLKLAPRRSGSEHLALARLQHAHIVPLFGASDHPGLGLRSLCMPYHGSLTLHRLAEALAEIPPARRTGLDILRALDASHAGLPVEVPAAGPMRGRLAGWTFAEAVAWAGACLAEALQHAHERGLIHLDLKPTNILLAADGQPMLLDFHLARKPIRPDDPEPGSIGGTASSMSPEQAETLGRARAGLGPRSVVDGRSDQFSLGLVLYQVLGGPWPPPPLPLDATRALRKANPAVSAGLAAILGRSLEPRPAGRYPDAGSLAEDLRRHLANRPLRGVRVRDPVERWRKWRRRRPHALGLVAMALAVVAAAAIVGFNAWMARSPRPLVGVVERPNPDSSDRARAAERFSRAVARLRAEVAPPRQIQPAEARELAALCREFWDERRNVLDPTRGPLPEATERRIRADLAEMVALSTRLEALAEPRDRLEAERAALERLDRAAAELGASPALDGARRAIREGEAFRPPSPTGKAAPATPTAPPLRARPG